MNRLIFIRFEKNKLPSSHWVNTFLMHQRKIRKKPSNPHFSERTNWSKFSCALCVRKKKGSSPMTIYLFFGGSQDPLWQLSSIIGLLQNFFGPWAHFFGLVVFWFSRIRFWCAVKRLIFIRFKKTKLPSPHWLNTFLMHQMKKKENPSNPHFSERKNFQKFSGALIGFLPITQPNFIRFVWIIFYRNQDQNALLLSINLPMFTKKNEFFILFRVFWRIFTHLSVTRDPLTRLTWNDIIWTQGT